MEKCYLAIDIGASSGRHILGFVREGKMILKEVYRFENGQIRRNGHLCWDMDRLFREVINGLRACREAGYIPETIGIDTWGVDYVLLDGEGRRIGDAVAYRDSRTAGIREVIEKETGLTFAQHYARTGIQYEPFNTAYQLYAHRKEHPEELEQAASFLMVPDYLNYRLTGVISNEYTEATTSALVNAVTKQWDDEIIAKLGLPRKIFQPLRMPGTILGELTPEVLQETGYDGSVTCRVILPATHDTGSAFLAVPARDEHAVTLSSGTWSLLGTEIPEPVTTEESCSANFTNEGGYQYRFRYLKNIMGLWMVQSVRRELGELTGQRPGFPELIAAAQEAAAKYSRAAAREAAAKAAAPAVIDVDAEEFLSPESMITAIKDMCRRTGQPVPETTGEVVLCIYNSLSEDYRKAISDLSRLTGKTFTSINIVGGGSQDMYLNQAAADAAGIPVFAGPTEGTALGNLMVQFIAGGEFPDLESARKAIKTSFDIKEVLPQ